MQLHKTMLSMILCAGLATACATGGAQMQSPRREPQASGSNQNRPAGTAAGDSAAQNTNKLRAPDVIYVPTPQEAVEEMLRVANVRKGDVLYDLGSGDG